MNPELTRLAAENAELKKKPGEYVIGACTVGDVIDMNDKLASENAELLETVKRYEGIIGRHFDQVLAGRAAAVPAPETGTGRTGPAQPGSGVGDSQG